MLLPSGPDTIHRLGLHRVRAAVRHTRMLPPPQFRRRQNSQCTVHSTQRDCSEIGRARSGFRVPFRGPGMTIE